MQAAVTRSAELPFPICCLTTSAVAGEGKSQRGLRQSWTPHSVRATRPQRALQILLWVPVLAIQVVSTASCLTLPNSGEPEMLKTPMPFNIVYLEKR